jgi:hypothetical protein
VYAVPTLSQRTRRDGAPRHPLREWGTQTSFKGHPPDHVENGFTFHECLLLASWCGQLGLASLREDTSVVRYRGKIEEIVARVEFVPGCYFPKQRRLWLSGNPVSR